MRYLLLLVVLANGCSCSDASGDAADAGPATPFDGMSASCSPACATGTICDRSTRRCVPAPMCTGHSECPAASFCAADMHCASSAPGAMCATDINCVPGERCSAGRCGCGGERYGADAVPPNVLIVLDRSSSMNEAIPRDGRTKWEVAQTALQTLLTTYGSQIRFGFMLYPGENQSCSMGMDCGPGTVFIDVAAGTAPMIQTFLPASRTCMFGTPTAEALDVLPTYAPLHDASRANYVLLITDGQSTCEDPVAVVRSLRMGMPEIRTFVVGFGGGVDPTELTDMAMAGGTARMGTPAYFQADDAASLDSALMSIAGTVLLTCTFTLSAAPPDPALLFVYGDRMPITRSTMHTSGWDYDATTNQITFYGPDCDAIMAGTREIVIQYGCPIDVF